MDIEDSIEYSIVIFIEFYSKPIQLDVEKCIEYSMEISIEFYRVSHSTAKVNREVNRILFNRVFIIQLN